MGAARAASVTGDCWIHFAFDAAAGIDLERVEALMPAGGAVPGSSTSRESLSERRRTPPEVQFRPKPLRLVRTHEAIELTGDDDARARTEPDVEITLYDFGAVSVAYRIRFADVDLEALRRLSTLVAARGATLHAHARAVVERLIAELGRAAKRASIADPVEDYVVFHVERWTGEEALPFDLVHDGAAIAVILRAADEPLSDPEVADALACVIAYGRRDLAVLDWNAAVIVEPDPVSAADLLTVLEFANVELVELRFLDDRLDAILDRAYREFRLGDAEPADAPDAPRGRLGAFAGWSRAARRERRRLAALHMDSALLFEGVNNAIKLLGDQYLARVYRLAARRLHLADWDAAILRKIDTLQRLYEKAADEQATRRMEVLEWIIIILIALSIVVMFIPGAK